jgi:hypothetical protein
MLAHELRPGDTFRIPGHTDAEGPVRVCLANDPEKGLRFGFPDRPGFWCFMGSQVQVEVCGGTPT